MRMLDEITLRRYTHTGANGFRKAVAKRGLRRREVSGNRV